MSAGPRMLSGREGVRKRRRSSSVLSTKHSRPDLGRTLKSILMTVLILPETLRKRRAAKARQRMDAAALRRWIDL